ncbi:DUF937 domain-containing protein [Ornithinibacter aureus]|uniref:DUF937 domain-containing protein n=1 Tax=Ornithinibacter aureus TaxID=622664 RepID=A0ABP8JT32_9MICO|nr:DUF937 domain-containing protein [Ornithinibacter aureus]KAF0833406.1 hypothetical protein C8E84_1190 [Ornithinibacter aureus]
MSALDDILGALPADAISQQVGASPDEVRAAAAAVLPALLGGLQANASDPSGAGSILEALGQHQDDLLSGGADLSAINESDGQAITHHIFGDREEDVVNKLGEVPAMGGSGMGGALVKKLLPILAPMVLSWLAKQVLGGGAGGGGLGGGGAAPQRADTSPSLPGSTGGAAGGPGSLDDMLRDVLGGATGGASTAPAGGGAAAPGGIDPGSIIGDILGGMLGGGRR